MDAAGGPFFFAAKKFESDAEDRCRYGRSRRAIPHCCDDGAAVIRKSGLEIKNQCTKEGVNGEIPASIRKFGLEIKNRCMQEGVNGEKLTSIRKSGLEIKNQCTKEGVNGENLAVIRKFGLEIKNRCTKQPIFSTLPQQIPQYIPQHAFHHALTTRLALDVCMGRARAGLTVAAKAGADAPGGGISLCFCRRGCAAPAQKAASLNDSRCSTRPTRLHANSFCRISAHRHWCRTACVSLQAAR